MIKRSDKALAYLRDRALANGMSYDSFRGRIRRGHTDEEILTGKSRKVGRKSRPASPNRLEDKYSKYPSIKRMKQAKDNWLFAGDNVRAEVVNKILKAHGVT